MNRIPTSRHEPADVDQILAAAKGFKIAARRIADDPTLDVTTRCLSLVELSRQARQRMPASFADATIWSQVRHLFGKPVVPRGMVEAIRKLIRAGKSECPCCQRPLPDHGELDRWMGLQMDVWGKAS